MRISAQSAEAWSITNANIPPLRPDAAIRTCAIERNHPKYGTPHCSGGNLPPPGPQGRNRGTFEFVTLNAKNACHSDRSVSGVEESTTWDNEPSQDKICYLRGFLDSVSLRSE